MFAEKLFLSDRGLRGITGDGISSFVVLLLLLLTCGRIMVVVFLTAKEDGFVFSFLRSENLGREDCVTKFISDVFRPLPEVLMFVFETLPDGFETRELRFGDGTFLTWEFLEALFPMDCPLTGLSFSFSSSLCNELIGCCNRVKELVNQVAK